MDSLQKVKECKTHGLKYNIIDLKAKSNQEKRYLCPKCLISDQRNMIHIDDASEYLEDKRTVFLYQKETQSKKNIGVLKELESNLMFLKNYYVQTIDKINTNIGQKIILIEEEQNKLRDELKQSDLDLVLSQKNDLTLSLINYQQIQSILQKQLESLSDQDKLHKCILTLQSIDDQRTPFTIEDKSWAQDKIESKQTPSLPLTCQTHSKEIIFFNLSEQKTKDNRLACASCVSGKVGPFIELEEAQKRWNTLQTQRKQILSNKQEKLRLIVQTVQQSIQQFQREITLNFQEVNQKLNNILNAFLSVSQLDTSKMDRDWNQISREEIISFVDILSKPQYEEDLYKNSTYEFQKLDEEINQILQESQIFFQDQEQICFENLNRIHKFDKKIYNKETTEAEIQVFPVGLIDQFCQTTRNIADAECQIDKSEQLKYCSSIVAYGSEYQKKRMAEQVFLKGILYLNKIQTTIYSLKNILQYYLQ